MSTSIDLNPPTFQILTSEIIPFTVEWQDLIGIGNTVTLPSGVMYDNSNGVLATDGFQNNFGVNGTQTQFIMDGTKLQPGHFYTAILTVTSNGQIYKSRVTVSVPR